MKKIRLRKDKLKVFPFEQINVKGEIGHRMDLTAGKILNHIDIENDFARHYKQRTETPDVHGGFTGYGMFLDAMVSASKWKISVKGIKKLKDRLLRELIASQSDDGSISIFSNKKGMWDNHDQAYIIQALINDYRFFKNKKALDAAYRLGDYLISISSTPNIGMEKAFLMLYQESGEKRYLDFLKDKLYIQYSLEDYDNVLEINGLQHVYTCIARILAQVQSLSIDKLSCKTFLESSQNLYNKIFCKGYASISGSCTGSYLWGEIWDRTQIGLGKWGETCASAYLMRWAAEMIKLTGDSVYGDLFERVMYNAFFASQSKDGLLQRYFTPFNETGEWYSHDTYCCPNNFRRMMFEVPDSVYLSSKDAVWLNLYTDSSLETPILKIVQKTGYPEKEHISVEIYSEKNIDLRFRIPRWCGNATIKINGECDSCQSGTWYICKVKNKELTKILLTLPMPVRYVRGTMAQQDRIAIMRGPLVYAIEQELNSLSFIHFDLLECMRESARVNTEEQVRIHQKCLVPNTNHQECDVIFTRFTEPKRSKTYFERKNYPKDKTGTVRDELFDSPHSM